MQALSHEVPSIQKTGDVAKLVRIGAIAHATSVPYHAAAIKTGGLMKRGLSLGLSTGFIWLAGNSLAADQPTYQPKSSVIASSITVGDGFKLTKASGNIYVLVEKFGDGWKVRSIDRTAIPKVTSAETQEILAFSKNLSLVEPAYQEYVTWFGNPKPPAFTCRSEDKAKRPTYNPCDSSLSETQAPVLGALFNIATFGGAGSGGFKSVRNVQVAAVLAAVESSDALAAIVADGQPKAPAAIKEAAGDGALPNTESRTGAAAQNAVKAPATFNADATRKLASRLSWGVPTMKLVDFVRTQLAAGADPRATACPLQTFWEMALGNECPANRKATGMLDLLLRDKAFTIETVDEPAWPRIVELLINAGAPLENVVAEKEIRGDSKRSISFYVMAPFADRRGQTGWPSRVETVQLLKNAGWRPSDTLLGELSDQQRQYENNDLTNARMTKSHKTIIQAIKADYARDYQQAATAQDLRAFIDTFRDNDPNDLVPKAQARLTQIETQAAKLQQDQDRSAAAAAKKARDDADKRIALWRRELKAGDDTSCGPALELKGPMVKVYRAIPGYSNEHWIKRDQAYPADGSPCEIAAAPSRQQTMSADGRLGQKVCKRFSGTTFQHVQYAGRQVKVNQKDGYFTATGFVERVANDRLQIRIGSIRAMSTQPVAQEIELDEVGGDAGMQKGGTIWDDSSNWQPC